MPLMQCCNTNNDLNVCVICGNKISHERLLKCKDTCCKSCAMKKAMKSDELRQRISNKIRKYYDNEENRKNLSNIIANAWKNDEYRQSHVVAAKLAHANEELNLRISKTCKQVFNTPEIKQKISNTLKEHWANPEERDKHLKAINNEKVRAKIGKSVHRAFQNPEVKERHRQAISNALKHAYAENGEIIKTNVYATKKNNGTFNSSKPEKDTLDMLQQKFNKVHYQYRCDRYPFACDFYIEDIDLFIELNFHWTHGGRPFNENDKDCIDKLASWKEKAKTSKFYQNAIYTWTDLDVRKAKCAKDNNLNWICLYNWSDFNDNND